MERKKEKENKWIISNNVPTCHPTHAKIIILAFGKYLARQLQETSRVKINNAYHRSRYHGAVPTSRVAARVKGYSLVHQVSYLAAQ